MSGEVSAAPETKTIVDALVGAWGLPAKEAVSRGLDDGMRQGVLAELNARANGLLGSARKRFEWHVDVVNGVTKERTREEIERLVHEGRRYQLLPVSDAEADIYEFIRMSRTASEVYGGYEDHPMAYISMMLEAYALVAAAPPSQRPSRVQAFETMFVKAYPSGMPAMRAATLVAKLPECFGERGAADRVTYFRAIGDRLAAAGWAEGGSLCHLAVARAFLKEPGKAFAMLGRARELAPALRNRYSFLHMQLVLSFYLPPSPPQLALLMGVVDDLEKEINKLKGGAPARWEGAMAFALIAAAISATTKSGYAPVKMINRALKIQKRLLKEGKHPHVGQLRKEMAGARMARAILLIPGAAKMLPRLYGVMATAMAADRSNAPMDPAEMEAITARFERWAENASEMMDRANSDGEMPKTPPELMAEMHEINKEVARMSGDSTPLSADKVASGQVDANAFDVFNAHTRAEQLLSKGQSREALDLVERAIAAWRQAYFTTLSMDEARAIAQGGQRLPAFAARLRIKDMDAGSVLRMLAADAGMMASDVTGDAARRLAQALPRRASEVLALRQEIIRQRAKLSVSFDEQKLASSYEALSASNARWIQIWNEAGGSLPSVELKELAAAAPAGGVIVTLATTATGSTAFILKSDASVDKLDLPDLTAFRAEQMTRSFLLAEVAYVEGLGSRRAMSAADFDDALLASARECWTDLVGPLEDKLAEMGVDPKAPLTFVGMGHMDQLPLQAAWCPVGSGREHLLQRRVVRFAPSFGALLALRRRKEARRGAASNVLGFFVPAKNGKEIDLKGSINIELPRLREMYGDRLKLYESAFGTRNNFLNSMEGLATSLNRIDLHLSLHGDFNAIMPEFSALKLRGSFGAGDVTVLDLLALPPSEVLDSVCMACCRTGKRDVLGEGYEAVGLVEAFLALGASSVLASLYPIIDDATAELLPDMYAERQKGADLAEALTAVIRARLNRRDVPPLPLINWAAFRATCA